MRSPLLIKMSIKWVWQQTLNFLSSQINTQFRIKVKKDQKSNRYDTEASNGTESVILTD